MNSLRFAFASTALALVFACGSDPATGANPQGNDDPNRSGGFGDDTSDGGPGDDSLSCAATTAQTSKGKVDIVFIIDSSDSMKEEMDQIKANVNTFASKIGAVGLDYTVTLITPKAKDPTEQGNVICVPPPLANANCADRPPTFLHVDSSVSSHESLFLLIDSYEDWSGHVRFDATKVFVAVTDDESSWEVARFEEELFALTPAGMFGTSAKRNYVFHSIVSKPASVAAPSTEMCPTADGTSVEYQKLSLLTGGLIDEVCKTDYSGVLDNIAKGIVDKVGCVLTYPSADAADPTKLAVRFTPAGGTAKNLTQVTDASKCGTIADAWYYDDAAKPTKIILCPSTCTAANEGAGSKVEALVGCKVPEPK